MISITYEMTKQILTPRGGMTRKTATALGISYPLVSGWRKRLEGLKISSQQWAVAVACAKSGAPPKHNIKYDAMPMIAVGSPPELPPNTDNVVVMANRIGCETWDLTCVPCEFSPRLENLPYSKDKAVFQFAVVRE